MIFITGFARGGTSWLRDCVAFHQKIRKIPGEIRTFTDNEDRAGIEQMILSEMEDKNVTSEFFVNKAPANSPFIARACALFPESRFLFIVRDPRDVFVSHKRGTRAWMGGSNSTVNGCMAKMRGYFEGYLQAQNSKNLMLVTYEQLHQDFHETMRKIYGFIGVPCDDKLLEACYEENNFLAAAGRRSEDRDHPRRKGVVGDWANYLKDKEKDWYRQDPFWSKFLVDHGYPSRPMTFESVLSAMAEAGAHVLDEDEILRYSLRSDTLNVTLLHDIDELGGRKTRDSILATAQIEAGLRMPSIYNLLPLDDRNYRGWKAKHILKLIEGIKAINPKSGFGLHLNAAERFFPKDLPESDDSHPLMEKAVQYLHRQIDDYEKIGVRFRFCAAHGYGRGKKRPNNRDSPRLTEELRKLGIASWDNVIRKELDSKATHVTAMHDVGEPLAVNRMPHAGKMDDPDSYRCFPKGGLIRFLTHPGNYDIRRPLVLGARYNQAPRQSKGRSNDGSA
jgi:hypothetical protein